MENNLQQEIDVLLDELRKKQIVPPEVIMSCERLVLKRTALRSLLDDDIETLTSSVKECSKLKRESKQNKEEAEYKWKLQMWEDYFNYLYEK